MTETVGLLVLVAVFVWWFRRTPMYRAHRRTGVVPSQGQYWNNPTFHGQRVNVPQMRPEMWPDDDPKPTASGHWWRWHDKRAGSDHTR